MIKIVMGVLVMLVLAGCSEAINEAVPEVVVDKTLVWEEGAWNDKRWR